MPPFFIHTKKRNTYLMKKSYLISERTSALSVKPSKTIRLLLMALLCFIEKFFVKKRSLDTPPNSIKTLLLGL
jgi:hypothetical protein